MLLYNAPVFSAALVGQMFGAIDFTAYGMKWVFNPKTMSDAVPADYMTKLNVIKSMKGADGHETFVSGTGHYYAKGALIGKGTFGSVYKCVRRSDNANLVIKELNETAPNGPLREAIIQIIIFNVSKDLDHPDSGLRGPYVPILYEVGYDVDAAKFYIVSEEMKSTTYKMLRARKDAEVDLRFAAQLMLLQMANILDDLYKLVRFNHRDLKTDNAMFTRDARGYVQIRLIDFGFSCLNYDGVMVNGGGGGLKHCSLETRDMTQYMYEMYRYHPYLPADFKELLAGLLTFPVGRKVCRMASKCENVKGWSNTYDFMNSGAVENPNALPAVVEAVVTAYSEKEDWAQRLRFTVADGLALELPIARPAVPVECAIGKLFNPHTARCVLADGKVGKELLAAAAVAPNKNVAAAAIGAKSCPTRSRPIWNPLTKRCVVSCPTGQRRNAKTYKCVKKA